MLARMEPRRQPKTPFDDLFGIENELKVAESGVRDVFTPHRPIQEADLLFGRQDEVQSLVQTLNTPGQHVLLYGERGVGKSSLANIVQLVLKRILRQYERLHFKRCDQADTFESILAGPLRDIGADLTMTQYTKSRTKNAEGSLKMLKAGVARGIVETYAAQRTLSPSTVAEALEDVHGLLVIDEADAISNTSDRRKIAELIKLLSDANSPFKVMVVGIAATGAELTAAHPSVQRCLRETKLERMSNEELRLILEDGARTVDLYFSQEVREEIVALSAGYPHFTHLIALKCAELAVMDGRTKIEMDNMAYALTLAVRDAEGSLKEAYDAATRSFNTDMYRHIIMAASSFTLIEFNAADLRGAIQRETGEPISQASLNNYLQRLVSDDGSTIFTRTAKGVYRFTDPRMTSYVRMIRATS